MRKIFDEIERKLQSFIIHKEDNYFSSSINELYYKLTNYYPETPDVVYPLGELQLYAHALQVAEGDDIQKYYQLSLQRLKVLEIKAEQAGAI